MCLRILTNLAIEEKSLRNLFLNDPYCPYLLLFVDVVKYYCSGELVLYLRKTGWLDFVDV